MVMKKEKIYGFAVTDKNGLGFTRWFNGNENITADNPEGKLPFDLNSIYVNQHYLNFNSAVKYIMESSLKNQKLTYNFLTEESWNAIQHPVKRFIKNLRKSLHIGIS